MIIVKCKKEGCEGHLVAFTAEGKPKALPNKTHNPTEIEITDELREQIAWERFSEPFATFMDVVQEEGKE